MDQVFPGVGLAMTEVLERTGCQVEFRESQTCCGQPAFNGGFRDEARQVARHFLDVFKDAEYIVVPSGSCASMISHHYADLFEDHRESRVWEFSQFLTDVLKIDDVGARLDRVVTYHDSCHSLRELGSKMLPGVFCRTCAACVWSKWTPPRSAADSAGRFP